MTRCKGKLQRAFVEMNTFCVVCRKHYHNPNLLFPFPPPGNKYRNSWALRVTEPPESEWTDDFRICSLHFASSAFKKIGFDGKFHLKQSALPTFALSARAAPGSGTPKPAVSEPLVKIKPKPKKLDENPSEKKSELTRKTSVGKKPPQEKSPVVVEASAPEQSGEDAEDTWTALLNESTVIEEIIYEEKSSTDTATTASSNIAEAAEDDSTNKSADDISINQPAEETSIDGAVPPEGGSNSEGTEEVKDDTCDGKVVVISRDKACTVCKNPSRILFPFPKKNPKLFLKWTSIMKIPENKWGSTLRICSKHFSESSIVKRDGKVGLLSTAVPSLNEVTEIEEALEKALLCENSTISTGPTIITDSVLQSKENLPLLKPKKPECITVIDTTAKRTLQVPLYKTYAFCIRCALCMCQVPRWKAVPIREVTGEYTRFGFALATLIKTSYTTLQSKFCCLKCSEIVTDCYDTFVDINLTAQVASRRWDDYSGRPREHSHNTRSDICQEAFNEKCPDCDLWCADFTTYGQHCREHAFQRRLLPQPSVSVQADEFELYADSVPMENEEPIEEAHDDHTVPDPLNEDIKVGDEYTESIAVTDAFTGQTVVVDQMKKVKYEEIICHICGKILTSAQQHKRHLYNHKKTKTLRCCHLCGESVASVRMWLHLKTHTNPKKPGRKAKSGIKIKEIAAKGRENTGQDGGGDENQAVEAKPAPMPKKKKKTKLTSCDVCGMMLTVTQMMTHKRAVHGAPLMECSICGEKVVELWKHKLKAHKEEYEQEKILLDGTHNCELCSATYRQKSMLRIHMALKHGYDPRQLRIGKNGIADEWKCNVCEGKFTHYTDILTHVNKEHNGKGIRLTCEECGKTYNKMAALMWHVTGNHVPNYFNFKCTWCHGVFVSEERYIKHHDNCSKRFGSRKTNSKPLTSAIIVKDQVRSAKRHKENQSDIYSTQTLRYAESLGPPIAKKMKKEKDSGHTYSQQNLTVVKDESEYEYEFLSYSDFEQEREAHSRGKIGKQMRGRDYTYY